MRQLKYVIRYLLKGRGSNSIKIISLTLGLTVGLVLFSQIAFEMSYDSFYPGAERIYQIRRASLNDTIRKAGEPIIYAPVPGGMMRDIQGVECATVLYTDYEDAVLLNGNVKFTERLLKTDEHFTELFGFRIISGDPAKMALPHHVFLSRSTAERMFGKADPVGEMLLYVEWNHEKKPVTVAGVFEDIPENSSFDPSVLLSIESMFSGAGREMWWLGNDSYYGYVKLAPGVRPEEVEAQVPRMLNNYYDVKAEAAKGRPVTYILTPIRTLHQGEAEVKRLLIILTLLATSLLIVSAMNYVLISISSLVKRSRQVGVYKTCGASNGNIFSQFMWETVVLIGIALVLSVFLIFLFRGTIEGLIQTSVGALFSPSNLWVSGVLVVVLIVIAGVIPARIFSSVPVTQVFRAASVNKRYWKNILLFVQFTAIAWMICVLVVVVRQYHLLINKDLGYTIENIVYAKLSGVSKDRMKLIKTEFSRIPSVLKAATSTNIPLHGMNGDKAYDPETRQKIFLYKLMGADEDFFETFGMKFVSGHTFDVNGFDIRDVVVNETFAKWFEASGFPLDKLFGVGMNEETYHQIVGVVKDFQLANLYHEMLPVMICPISASQEIWWGNRTYLILRVDKPSQALLKELNAKLFSLTEDDNLEFRSFKSEWVNEYKSALLLRNSIIIASIIMLLITLLGLIGYVEDEILRRRKEIAIRKINGATVKDILFVIAKDFAFIVLPALVLGSIGAHFFSVKWLQQFVARISPGFPLFFSVCFLLLLLQVVCICLRSWKVANENPVKSIKTE